MPKVNKTLKKSNKIKVESLTCTMCGKTQKPKEHYKSFNPIHATGYIPYCKNCLKNICLDNRGIIDLDNVKKMLKIIDRPFIYSIFKKSSEDKMDTIGCYMKNLALNNKLSSWVDSKFELTIDDFDNNLEDSDFKVTQEMYNRWGKKYEKDEYKQLEQFYIQMKIDNKIETAQDEAYLKKLAVISLKLDTALEDGNDDKANKLGNLFSKYMGDSQFRAMDKSDSSKTGGLRTFSQIYAEIEKDDFIPPWEYYKKENNVIQDFVDKTIMYILNYTLKLNKISQLTIPPSDTPKLVDEED